MSTEPHYRSIWNHLMPLALRQDYLEIDGIQTRYVEAGPADAPPLLLLHGTGANWEIFAANLAPLSGRFRCIALDLLGHGFTGKPDHPYEIHDYVAHILEFLRQRRITRASFIGTSLGAWIAARLAIDHPALVDKLILMSPGGLAADLPTMQGISSVRLAAVENPSWTNIHAVLSSVIFESHNVLPDLIATRQQVYRQPTMPRAMRNILALQDPVIRGRNLISREAFASISQPTLVIASSDDTDVFVRSAYELGALIPGAQLVEMSRVGHMPQLEDPDTFNRHALEFLAS